MAGGGRASAGRSGRTFEGRQVERGGGHVRESVGRSVGRSPPRPRDAGQEVPTLARVTGSSRVPSAGEEPLVARAAAKMDRGRFVHRRRKDHRYDQENSTSKIASLTGQTKIRGEQ
ncbi:unnamed protein product [Parajaminaea phylloscopi]